jgi:hypothetical protein
VENKKQLNFVIICFAFQKVTGQLLEIKIIIIITITNNNIISNLNREKAFNTICDIDKIQG